MSKQNSQSKNKPLSLQQRDLIQALILRTTVVSEAAAQLGIHPKIALAWMQQPFMREAFDQARRVQVNKFIEEAQAGKIDNAMEFAALARPEDPTAHETSLQKIEDFSAHDPEVQAAHCQQWITDLKFYLQQPIQKVLVFR